MTEFIPVLIAAVLLFVGLLLAFGAVTVPPPYQPPPVEEPRHIILGEDFTVGYVRAEQELVNVSGTVSQGLLAAEDKRLAFELARPQDVTTARIYLHINDSNHYGPFVMILNGEEIYRGFPYPGDHTIELSKELLRERNELEISAGSSGWRFWAPTVYIFSAQIVIDWRPALEREFTFNLTGEDIAKAEGGRLVVYVESRQGTGYLTVKLNDRVLYSGIRRSIVSSFPPERFRHGPNELELSAPAGTRYVIDLAKIIIFWTSD
jgi:hypothetical protein